MRSLFVFCAIFLSTICTSGQQKFIAYASGPQAGSSSTRHLIADVTVLPPVSPGNVANLVFRGRGGTPFPPNADLALCIDAGVPGCGHLGFAPDSQWIHSFDVDSQGLDWLRQNKYKLVVFIPSLHGIPGGEVLGTFHLANGTYNDYDGDGKTDVQVYRNSNNTFYALLSANGAYREQPLGQPGDSVSLTVDFDGDGRSDFSTARYNAEVLWRILPSRTNILQETRWGSSTLGDFFAAADYDADARMDIAVFRAGVWHILLSGSGTYRQEYWGTAGDVPAATDFDKDGIADLRIARSEGGQRVWYTRMSTTGAMRVIPWGLSSDAFFTGRTDFDGDSAADTLVIRNDAGQRIFYINRSSDGQLQAIPWGLSSDVVKLGDYDGDGRTDLAVTRAANGQRVFYILQSSNGQVRYETFGLAGDF
ncbi:MAG TPA: VCBS repeat-containing protein [Pyrinomonadaceae bacterium]|nr:VCBS repeat-containing protein [Pyrinomonadaceae bacterium]